MPTLPSALTRGALAGADTVAGDWFIIEHAGGLFRISRYELAAALFGRNVGISGGLRIGDNYTLGPSPGVCLEMAKTITGQAYSAGVMANGYIAADVISRADLFLSIPQLAVGASPSRVVAYRAQQGYFAPGAVPAVLIGFEVDPGLVGGTNNYAFFGGIPAGANRWNCFMNGTAPNYFGGECYFAGSTTTASAANAVLNSGSSPANQLLRSTSSSVYKKDVEDLESARADAVVDQARPVWYRSKSGADREDWSWYGLIAEELAEIEPRLVTYGYQDQHYEMVEVAPATPQEPARMERRLKEDATMVPDGVAYERLTVMLLDVVRREKAKTAALEAALAALTARVEALESP